ncbi:hypothetical protein ONS95_013350 [Cadophora gregata]|uniref:uncharacterized protein n=1 Tax=Cadophora gregata TaxID=51156 RepID=UPI0026DAF369|nr:uncharacterized protein ONS95_013350 [Cadophora gregata]KAK0099757.1 hypothetical protein ONS96_008254 [Cadophora gregata f. sp. sojae]KAK0116329.1 hypothetical protein ONS95_013350 [Cadophora gregata]
MKQNITESAKKAKSLTTEQSEKLAALYRFSILSQVSGNFESTFFKNTVTWLLLILYMLRQRGEIDVADAIWHSVKADRWDVSLTAEENRNRGCFNSVAGFPPFDAEGNVPIDESVALEMFQLDWDRDGTLQQCWIVDSLFRDGYLSVGKLVRISTHDEFQFHPEWFGEEDRMQPDEEIVGHVESTITSTMASLGLDVGKRHKSGDTSPQITSEVIEAKPMTQSKIEGSVASNPQLQIPAQADTQLLKQLMMSKFVSPLADIPPRSRADPRKTFPSNDQSPLDKHNCKILNAATLSSSMNTDWNANGLTKIKSMRAVFDVQWDRDEQVKWLFTPYDQKTERLPHAEARSLSMSWVVEPTGQSPVGKEGAREVLRTKGTVKGMWKFMDSPMTQYSLV